MGLSVFKKNYSILMCFFLLFSCNQQEDLLSSDKTDPSDEINQTGDQGSGGNSSSGPASPVIDAPTGLALVNSSLGVDPRPSLIISGVSESDLVTLYSDSDCSSLIASGTGSNIRVNAPLVDGNHTIYAKVSNDSGTSLCSESSVSYNLSSCPSGYIPVLHNSDLGTNEDFCVMKYEAKNNGSNEPVSQAEGTPWVYIPASTDTPETRESAFYNCLEIGSGYALISNQEWMTIARDIESNPSNWSSGNTGEGFINRGHSDNSPSELLEASIDSDPFFGTEQSSGDQKRTHILSNGEVIWDLAGNAYEWIDWDKNSIGYTLGSTTCVTPSLTEFPDVNCSDLLDSEIMPSTLGANSSNGMGQFKGSSGGAILRGGYWSSGLASGLYGMLNFNYVSSYAWVTFRCVWRPTP